MHLSAKVRIGARSLAAYKYMYTSMQASACTGRRLSIAHRGYRPCAARRREDPRVTGDGGVLQALAALSLASLSARAFTPLRLRLASHGARCTDIRARTPACVRHRFDFALFLARRHGGEGRAHAQLRSTARGAGNARPLRVVCERCLLDWGLGRVEGADSGRKYVDSDRWIDGERAIALICCKSRPTDGRASERARCARGELIRRGGTGTAALLLDEHISRVRSNTHSPIPYIHS